MCASAAHLRRINEMEKLRTEYEELKTRMNGEFGGAEGPRKRGREEGSNEASGAAGGEAGAGGEFAAGARIC